MKEFMYLPVCIYMEGKGQGSSIHTVFFVCLCVFPSQPLASVVMTVVLSK